VVSRRRTTNRVTRPLEERIDLYNKALKLFSLGMRRGEIVREMKARYNVTAAWQSVVDWTEKGVSPFGRVYKFDAVPSPELAYLCGVKLGDATQSKGTWQHSYKFKLLTIDKEFATEFSRCASVVLKCRPFKVWWYHKRGMWCVEVSSIMLYKFLKEGVSRFKKIVNHCDNCAAAFIRGFFDSEGCASTSLTVSNGRLDVLSLVRRMLRIRFGIKTGNPSPNGPPPGTKKLIKGRLVTVNMQNYVVRVRSDSVRGFAKSVGFSIPRKAKSLELLLRKRGSLP